MIKYLEKEEDFKELTETKCLIDFYADWCGPCRMLGEVLLEFEKTNDLPVIKINTDKFNELSLKFGVMSIPCLFLMEKGEVLKKNIGYISLDELNEFVK
jgi:thioredoxin 1